MERTVIISDEERHRVIARGRWGDVVSTPLDLIVHLEDAGDRIDTVIVAGGYAWDRDLASFLGAFYPLVRVVRGAPAVA